MNVATPARVGFGLALAAVALGWLALPPSVPMATRLDNWTPPRHTLRESVFEQLDEAVTRFDWPLRFTTLSLRSSEGFDLDSAQARRERLAHFRDHEMGRPQ